jgi:rRNA maturation endonuclease Nob1
MTKAKTQTHYHLCPRCARATPASAEEAFCPNDGTRLLTACPSCARGITSPYSRFCTRCGAKLLESLPALSETDEHELNTKAERRKG